MKNILMFFLFLISTVIYSQPFTLAESSNFTSTSSYTDVIKFITELQKISSSIRVETMALTTQGREIPLIIIGNPLPASPSDLIHDDRAVIYLHGNIHAGEVEGKESLQMLARDILLGDASSYLENLILLIAPIFNADGNEKISTENRTRQVGPVNGVGERYNGQNLDLNRDGLKLETPEVKGLVENVMNRWDPVLLVDSHTHNGSYHEETATFVWSLNPNGDTTLIRYASDKMYPAVVKNLKENYEIPCIPHGDFVSIKEPEKGWRPLGPQPRYISNYIGLRNRIGILNENYPYSDFKTRVHHSYKLFRGILDYCYQNKDELIKIVKTADNETIKRGMNPGKDDLFITEYDVRPMKEKITVMGYEMKIDTLENGRRRIVKTDKRMDYTMPFLSEFYSKNSVRLPYAYLFPAELTEVVDKLKQHGVLVEKLSEEVNLNISIFLVNEVEGSKNLNQGHYTNNVKGEYMSESRKFPAGTYYVSMAQPLANVVSYLLEPESDDGLLVWNFFDRYLAKQWSREPQPYPVAKLFKSEKLSKKTVK